MLNNVEILYCLAFFLKHFHFIIKKAAKSDHLLSIYS